MQWVLRPKLGPPVLHQISLVQQIRTQTVQVIRKHMKLIKMTTYRFISSISCLIDTLLSISLNLTGYFPVLYFLLFSFIIRFSLFSRFTHIFTFEFVFLFVFFVKGRKESFQKKRFESKESIYISYKLFIDFRGLDYSQHINLLLQPGHSITIMTHDSLVMKEYYVRIM